MKPTRAAAAANRRRGVAICDVHIIYECMQRGRGAHAHGCQEMRVEATQMPPHACMQKSMPSESLDLILRSMCFVGAVKNKKIA